ncbi:MULTISPECIES: DUF4097 family beta strand repeat-containing protein [Sporosarcina]|uniref:DUF4097 and DUF4098 domain-containing protein YvlB n=1 Tax=Sporosarcina newyorkensis TaxID=759851 RepID=A0A1T4YHN9_9BACL|nr:MULTISPECIES: DUF4097 family beta strand repeat-containing protein [Sporosarcina]MBY0222783.1 DUF4097 family beta strand repeat protein [Sporosarcina aquimarina]SKB01223.1 DUF4097 and DUF4098 domain-containing protein YvlB [Sporosarcina newyorkensis]
MQNERRRILTLLEEGKITADEALKLLEALGKQTESTVQDEKPSTAQHSDLHTEQDHRWFDEQQKKKESTNPQDTTDESSADDFFEDIRKEFMTAGDRFMQFMDTAVQRVKTFDFEAPFGKSVSFTHTENKTAEDVEEIIIHIDHGKVEVLPSDGDEITAKFSVKHFNHDSETEARAQFLDKLLFVKDGNKLRIGSDLKMVQVNVQLYVPSQQPYRKLSVRLLNGGCTVEKVDFDNLRIKTANGKIECAHIRFDEAELETANGMVRLLKVRGNKLEAETLNGRVYVDGELIDIDAKSLNGNVSLTTTSTEATRLDAKSISGTVELYIPSTLGLRGEITSNMGKLDLQLKDVSRVEEQEQFLHRTIRFSKAGDDETKASLQVNGESRTGSVLVHYNSIEL